MKCKTIIDNFNWWNFLKFNSWSQAEFSTWEKLHILFFLLLICTRTERSCRYWQTRLTDNQKNSSLIREFREARTIDRWKIHGRGCCNYQKCHSRTSIFLFPFLSWSAHECQFTPIVVWLYIYREQESSIRDTEKWSAYFPSWLVDRNDEIKKCRRFLVDRRE